MKSEVSRTPVDIKKLFNSTNYKEKEIKTIFSILGLVLIKEHFQRTDHNS